MKKKIFAICSVIIIAIMAVVPCFAASIAPNNTTVYKPSFDFDSMTVNTNARSSLTGNGEKIDFDMSAQLLDRPYTPSGQASTYTGAQATQGLSSRYYSIWSPVTFHNNITLPNKTLTIELQGFYINEYTNDTFVYIVISPTSISIRRTLGSGDGVVMYLESQGWLTSRELLFRQRNMIDRSLESWTWFAQNTNVSSNLDSGGSYARTLYTWREGTPYTQQTITRTGGYVQAWHKMGGQWAVRNVTSTDPTSWAPWRIELHSYNKIIEWATMAEGATYMSMQTRELATNTNIDLTYNVSISWSIPVALQNDNGGWYYDLKTYDTNYTYTGPTLYLFNMDRLFSIKDEYGDYRTQQQKIEIESFIQRALANNSLQIIINSCEINFEISPSQWGNTYPVLYIQTWYDRNFDTIATWYNNSIGGIATSPSSMTTNFVGWLNTAINGIFQPKMFGEFGLGDIATWGIAMCLVMGFLKYFAGG